MLPDSRPIAFTVERIIQHIYAMYPSISRQEITQLVRRAIISGEACFMNEFKEPVGLTYDSTWLSLNDLSLHIQRQFRLPSTLADIYLYGTLDRYPFFDPTPYRIEERRPHPRWRECCPETKDELLTDIVQYFDANREEVGYALFNLLVAKKEFKIEHERFQIDLAVDVLSYPAIGVTRLNYGHLSGGEPRKKYTHYDLRKVIDSMCQSRKP